MQFEKLEGLWLENRTCQVQVMLCESWAIIWFSTYYLGVDMCLRYSSTVDFFFH